MRLYLEVKYSQKKKLLTLRKHKQFAQIHKLLVEVEPHPQGCEPLLGLDRPMSDPEKYVPYEVERVLHEQQICYISQLRRITTVFMNFLDIDITSRNAAVQLNAALSEVQKVTSRFEGSVNK